MRVLIDYSDGQYIVRADPNNDWKDSIVIDDRDWEQSEAFRKVAWGWDAFWRDIDQPSPAYGPRPMPGTIFREKK